MANKKQRRKSSFKKQILLNSDLSPRKTRSQSKINEFKVTNKRQNKDKATNMSEPNLQNLLHTLPPFDGKKESNIEFYLKQFDELATKAKIQDEGLKLIILKTKLSGNAREFLISSPDLQNADKYDNFKQKLLERFQTTQTLESAQNVFMTIKQTPEQNISEFVNSFNNAASHYLTQSGNADKPDAVNFLNLMKFTRFIDSIRPDIALEIRKSGAKDFNEAVDVAKRIERAFNSSNAEILNNTTSTSQKELCESLLNFTKSQTEQINQLQEELNNLKLAKSTEQKSVEKFCAICKTKTHETEKCFYNKKNSQARQTKNHRIRPNNYNQNFPHPNMHAIPNMGQMMPYSNTFQYPPNNYLGTQYQFNSQPSQFTHTADNTFPNNGNHYQYRQTQRGNHRAPQGRRNFRPKIYTPTPRITFPPGN